MIKFKIFKEEMLKTIKLVTLPVCQIIWFCVFKSEGRLKASDPLMNPLIFWSDTWGHWCFYAAFNTNLPWTHQSATSRRFSARQSEPSYSKSFSLQLSLLSWVVQRRRKARWRSEALKGDLLALSWTLACLRTICSAEMSRLLQLNALTACWSGKHPPDINCRSYINHKLFGFVFKPKLLLRVHHRQNQS